MTELTIKTKKKRDVVDITNEVNKILDSYIQENDKINLVHLFVIHTTAALAIADLDPGGTDLDYLDAFANLVPKFAPTGVEGIKYRHPHDPDHMPDHILSSLVGPSLTVPVKDGELLLGTWQRVVLFEFDGQRERRVVVSFL